MIWKMVMKSVYFPRCLQLLWNWIFEDADVIFSDNYFHLTDKEPYSVFLRNKDIINGEFKGASEVKDRLMIRSLRDTYQ